MTSDKTGPASAGPAPYDGLRALLPELELRDASLKGRFIKAIIGDIGPAPYDSFDLERDWSSATAAECRSALVFLWRADYMGGNPIDGSSIADRAIKAGAAAEMVRRLVELSTAKVPPCPKCSSARVVPIIRGEPTREAAEAAARGEAVIGGCLFGGSDPVWFCRDCRHEFGRVDGGSDE